MNSRGLTLEEPPEHPRAGGKDGPGAGTTWGPAEHSRVGGKDVPAASTGT